jgi:putative SOS response-associated peptidase YedK
MKDRTPFALGGLWENWRDPQSGEWIRTVAIITVPSNELIAQIHDRMPLILPKNAYERWLGDEPDPHDLLAAFPANLMVMWPVSTRVNSPDNDDASLLDPAA